MKGVELKPCPFCGVMSRLNWQGTSWGVRCVECAAMIERTEMLDVIEAWNKRIKE